MNIVELNQLCNHLWESATIMRGPVDSADKRDGTLIPEGGH
jgi:hypothetical protein